MTNAQSKSQQSKLTPDNTGVKKMKKDKKKKASARLNTLIATIKQAFENEDAVHLHTSAEILRSQLDEIYKKEFPNSESTL